ncbi:MAG TPA: putative glycoside hydrolase [Acidobacteriaceae bacterium]|nr:putative glycoside hydrolase [Acidobacteriaceae bacterium]
MHPSSKNLLSLAAAFALSASCLAALAQNNSNSGTIRVLNSTTHQAVLDPVVTVNGKVLTASNGAYTLPAGTQSVMARAPGYRAVTVSAADIQNHHDAIELHPFTVHALYLSEYGIASSVLRNSAFDIIKRGGANALVVNIKSDHGQLVYPSAIPLAKQIGARNVTTIHSLSDLVNTAHAQNIYIIARIVTFKDMPLATSKPEDAVHLADGSLFHDREGLHWTDPFKPEVRAYNIAIAVEAAKAGFDEVQFDYVRFPDSTSKLIVSGPTDEDHRIEAISSFLGDAHAALVPYNVFLSADIFGYTFWNTNDTGIGQQLNHLVDKTDYLCPMLYPSGFAHGIPGHAKPVDNIDDIHSTVKLTLDRGIQRTDVNPLKLRPWLQAFRDYAFGGVVFGPDQVATQISAANADHTDGWSLWNPRNVYSGIGLIRDANASKDAALPVAEHASK